MRIVRVAASPPREGQKLPAVDGREGVIACVAVRHLQRVDERPDEPVGAPKSAPFDAREETSCHQRFERLERVRAAKLWRREAVLQLQVLY